MWLVARSHRNVPGPVVPIGHNSGHARASVSSATAVRERPVTAEEHGSGVLQAAQFLPMRRAGVLLPRRQPWEDAGSQVNHHVLARIDPHRDLHLRKWRFRGSISSMDSISAQIRHGESTDNLVRRVACYRAWNLYSRAKYKCRRVYGQAGRTRRSPTMVSWATRHGQVTHQSYQRIVHRHECGLQRMMTTCDDPHNWYIASQSTGQSIRSLQDSLPCHPRVPAEARIPDGPGRPRCTTRAATTTHDLPTAARAALGHSGRSPMDHGDAAWALLGGAPRA